MIPRQFLCDLGWDIVQLHCIIAIACSNPRLCCRQASGRRERFKKIEGIGEAYLYGSFARKRQDAAGDLDVLVIGNPSEEVLAEAMRKLERQLGREINYTVLTRKEFESRRARKDAFLENVWRNKRVLLVGAA